MTDSSTYPILQYPDPRLKETGDVVTDFGPETQAIIDKMLRTFHQAENCAALAATQLGVRKRITVIDVSPNKDNLIILVNPEIEHIRGTTNMREGCMSVGKNSKKRGGFSASVQRTDVIRVKAQDRHGKPLDFEADGFLSKCIQHETDHLHGILFIDKLSNLKRKLLLRNL